MNMKKIYGILGAAALLSLAAGCAKDASISSNEQSKKYIEAWLQINHPEAVQAGPGIYILSDEPGTGKEYDGETYPMLSYTLSGMDGTISSTTDEQVAKQIGIYEKGNYYGSKVMINTEKTMAVGVEAMLDGMKAGGTRTALIPSWLLGNKRYKHDSEYIKHNPSDVSTTIYKITLTDFTDDITEWENNVLEEYVKSKYPGLDSTYRGYYFKQVGAPDDTVSFKKDTTVYINYIGRLLNGQVFDTTIGDTAKKYGVFANGRTYEPALINWGEKFDDLSMGTDKSSMISGFKQTLWRMRSHGKYVGIFNSNYGYSNSGSGGRIPPFCPLIFEVEQVDKD